MINHAPGINIEVGGAEAGDGIHNQQSVVARGAHQICDTADIVPRTGRTLRGLDEDCANLGREPGADFVERERLPVGHAHNFRFAAEGFHQSGPAFAELPRSEHEDVVAWRGQV